MTGSTTSFRGAPAPGALISNLRQHREVPMRNRFAINLLGSFALAAGLTFPTDADAVQEVVDFRNIGEQNGPALRVGSLTVTGSSNIFTIANPCCGLGIEGGGGPGVDDPRAWRRSFSLSQVRPQT